MTTTTAAMEYLKVNLLYVFPHSRTMLQLPSSFSAFNPIQSYTFGGAHFLCKTLLLLCFGTQISLVSHCFVEHNMKVIAYKSGLRFVFVCLVLLPLLVSVHCLPICFAFVHLCTFVLLEINEMNRHTGSKLAAALPCAHLYIVYFMLIFTRIQNDFPPLSEMTARYIKGLNKIVV